MTRIQVIFAGGAVGAVHIGGRCLRCLFGRRCRIESSEFCIQCMHRFNQCMHPLRMLLGGCIRLQQRPDELPNQFTHQLRILCFTHILSRRSDALVEFDFEAAIIILLHGYYRSEVTCPVMHGAIPHLSHDCQHIGIDVAGVLFRQYRCAVGMRVFIGQHICQPMQFAEFLGQFIQPGNYCLMRSSHFCFSLFLVRVGVFIVFGFGTALCHASQGK